MWKIALENVTKMISICPRMQEAGVFFSFLIFLWMILQRPNPPALPYPLFKCVSLKIYSVCNVEMALIVTHNQA